MSVRLGLIIRFLARYAIGPCAVGVGLALRLVLVRNFGELPLFITFYPAVMVAALFGGLGPGLLATALAALAVDIGILHPIGLMSLSAANAIGLSLFVTMGACISVMVELYHRSRQRAAAFERDLAVQEALRASEASLRKLNRTLRALGKSNHALIHAADEQELLQAVCSIIVEDCGHAMVWIGYAEDDENKSVRPVASAGFEAGYLEALKITWADNERGRGPTGVAIRTGQPACCRNMLTDPRLAPWRAEALRRGYASSLALPLIERGRAFGAITIYAREPDAFAEDEVHLLRELADDLAHGIGAMRLRTANALAHQALEQSSEQRRLALEAAELGAWDYRFDTGDVFWDEHCRNLWGILQGDSIDYDAAIATIHDEDRAATDEAVKRALAGQQGGAYHQEFRVVWPDGSLHWIASHGRVFFEGVGEGRRPVRFIGVNREITERKRLENAQLFLAQSCGMASGEDFFQSLARYLAENLAMDFVCIDRLLADDLTAQTLAVYFDGKFEDNVAYALKDTPCGDVVGKTICCFPRAVRHLFPRDAVLQEMMAESYVGTTLWGSKGRPIGLIAIIGRQPLANPQLAEAILKLVAIRAAGELERNQAEEALRVANTRLAEADRRKDEFLAMLAHELRNPLAPIRNAVQILKLVGPQESVLAKNREIIERQAAHMGRLLDDLLDVSRVTRGKIVLRREPLDLRTVVLQAVEVAAHSANGRRIEIHHTNPPEPIWLEGDFTRLEQVVGNLLNNALKYTDEGWIRVGIECVPDPKNDRHWAAVRVRDTGIGISPDVLPRVFELFAQADQTLERTRGGLGIGLTMVKSLVDLHGGRVEARSPGLGQGSEFTVFLPVLDHARAPDAPDNDPPAGTVTEPMPLKVLVVDDNIDAATSLKDLLEMWGNVARTAHDGPDAVRQALAFVPDVILLDIGLPGMSGYAVARRLREEPALESVKMIALTGYGQEEDRKMTNESGFNAHLVKPVDLRQLQNLLARIAVG